MAASTGSLETSGNSHHAGFTFSNHFTSFSDLLAGAADDGSGHNSRQGGVPKFKSITPPSLPISPPPVSPSSYFNIPAGLSPAELLDSPVLLASSNIFPSPTTGTFPLQTHNWRANYANHHHQEQQQQQQGAMKDENRASSEFSFQTRISTYQPSSIVNSSEEGYKCQQQSWRYQETNPTSPERSTLNSNIKSEFMAPIRTSSTDQFLTLQSNNQSNNSTIQSNSTNNQQRKSDDGYNWRKYGQKQVKGSENPRSYYKCTYPNCPTKKKVERSLDGQITEIVYKGTHNHPKPQSTRRNSASSQAIHPLAASEASENSFGTPPMESAATPEISSASFGDDDVDMNSQRTRSGGDELDEDEPDAKRWKKEGGNEGISASGNRTVREPRVVVQTTSDIDILDDGYRWRKYGQKVVKGNPNPRSYYKCTSAGCPVRKHVERASHDLRAVITTYEGKHNHDVPAARGSGSHAVSRPSADNGGGGMTTAIRPSAMATHSNHMANSSLFSGGRPSAAADRDQSQQAPITLEMLQSSSRNYGFSGYESLMNQQQQQKHMENMFSKAKEEPRDQDFFSDSLLC